MAGVRLAAARCRAWVPEECEREYLVLLADDQMPERDVGTADRWGVFLNDFDQFIHGCSGWLSVPPTSAGIRWPLFGCHPRSRRTA
jgi:hypothetical protein